MLYFILAIFFLGFQNVWASIDKNTDLCKLLLLPQDVGTVRAAETIKLKLKSIYRTGWRVRGVPDHLGESIWDHTIKVSRAAVHYSQSHKDINAERARLLAVVHDLAEYKVPDFIPNEISKEEKFTLENEAIEEIVQIFGPKGQWIRMLWNEYESQLTVESRIVRQLDKLDAGVQALEYEKLGYGVSDFFDYVKSQLEDATLKQIYEFLLERRKQNVSFYDLYYEALRVSGHPKRLKEFLKQTL
jgi:putative hydrolases of HD superfamily